MKMLIFWLQDDMPEFSIYLQKLTGGIATAAGMFVLFDQVIRPRRLW